MEIEEIKKILKTITTISFSKHFHEPKVRLRGISEDEITTNLKNPNKLLFVEDQGEEPQGHKYALLFSKSNKYDLKIVISIKDKNLKVITSHIQNIKRRKVYEKWLKKQK